jgi:hypothetical protein
VNSKPSESLRTVLDNSILKLRHDPRVLFEKKWDYQDGLNGQAINCLALELFGRPILEHDASRERRLLIVRHTEKERPPIVWTTWSRSYGEHQASQDSDFNAAIHERAKFKDTIAYLESWKPVDPYPTRPMGARKGSQTARGGRGNLSRSSKPEDIALVNLRRLIQAARSQHAGMGPKRLRSHFEHDKDFQQLLKRAKQKDTVRFFRAAIKWIKENPGDSH